MAAVKVVRRALADGSIREYHYPRNKPPGERWNKSIKPKSAAPKREKRPGVVYFLQAGSAAIKIGFTYDLATRVSNIEVSNYEQIRILGAFMAPPRLEFQLLRKFRDLVIRGSWHFPDRRIEREIVALGREFPKVIDHGAAAVDHCFEQAADFAKRHSENVFQFPGKEPAK